MVAIFSINHGNAQALGAVLQDMAHHGVNERMYLGGVAGDGGSSKHSVEARILGL